MDRVFLESSAEEFMRKHGLKAVTVTEVVRDGEEEVFDITVPGYGTEMPASFIANDLVVHNSGEPNYAENIIHRLTGKKMSIRDVFGVRDEKTGAYIIKPLIRYRTGDTAEVFFDWMSQMLRKLPDKKKIGNNWYYLYRSKDKDGKVDKEAVKIVGNKYDEAYFKKTGIYRIPAPDGTLQAIILLDSYPAMLPEVLDVDDPNDALAAQARMFSTQLRRVKGRMRSKRVAVLGVNILREVPMAMYGPKEKETCGTALKQYSDVRIRHSSRALSGVPYLPTSVSKKGMQIEEKSVDVKHGVDTYRFIHVRADKNKLSRPYLETWLRLWISDGKNKAQGFDPVWDTFCLTGDSLVATNKGLKRIDELGDFKGIQVVSNDGKLHDITAWRKQGVKKVYSVTTKQGMSLTMTGDHRVYVLNSTGVLEWKRLDKVDPETETLLVKLGMPFSKRRIEIDNPYVPVVEGRGKNQFGNRLAKKIILTEDLAYLMGYLVSDGNLGSDEKSVHFYTSDNDARRDIEEKIERVFKQTACVYSGMPGLAKKIAYSIRLHSVEVFQVLKALGMDTKRSREKTIPWSILQSPKKIAVSFLRGLYAGDGSIGEGDFTCYSSTSSELLKQVTLLQWALGIPTNKAKNSGYSARLLKNTIGWVKPEMTCSTYRPSGVSKAHEEKLPVNGKYGYGITFNTALSGNNGGGKYRDLVKHLKKVGLRCARITDISPAGKQQTYDITVADSENFIANGIVVHNCYLMETGQAEGKMGSFRIKMEKFEAKKSIGWYDFKSLILGDRKKRDEICASIGMKTVDLRKECFKQLGSGKGIELYNAALISQNEKKSEKSERGKANDAESSDSSDDE